MQRISSFSSLFFRISSEIKVEVGYSMIEGFGAFSAFIEHPLNNIKLIEINILFMVFSFGRYIMTK